MFPPEPATVKSVAVLRLWHPDSCGRCLRPRSSSHKKAREPESGLLKAGFAPSPPSSRPWSARWSQGHAVSTMFNFNSSNFFSGRGKKRFLSFVFLALFLALARFCSTASFFCSHNRFSTTTLKHKNVLSGILLIFYYVLMFFSSAFVVKFSTCFPLFLLC